jgi:RNA-binding protein YlmH
MKAIGKMGEGKKQIPFGDDKQEKQEQPKGERLQKILAAAGIASRRKAEEIILAGRVQVNGQVVAELGTKHDPAATTSGWMASC